MNLNLFTEYNKKFDDLYELNLWVKKQDIENEKHTGRKVKILNVLERHGKQILIYNYESTAPYTFGGYGR